MRTLNYSRPQRTHVEFCPQTSSSEIYLVLKSKKGIMSQRSYFLFNKNPRLHYWDVFSSEAFLLGHHLLSLCTDAPCPKKNQSGRESLSPIWFLGKGAACILGVSFIMLTIYYSLKLLFLFSTWKCSYFEWFYFTTLS